MLCKKTYYSNQEKFDAKPMRKGAVVLGDMYEAVTYSLSLIITLVNVEAIR